MRIAVLALLAAAGLAQEPVKKPTPNVKQRLTRGEWDHLVDTIRKGGQTTVKQLAALKSAAGKYLVVETGKIVDIKPATGFGEGSLEIVLWSRRELSTSGFIVRAPRAVAVMEWGKWDRVSWVSLPVVRGADLVELTPVYRDASDLKRTPNPGIEWPKFTKARESIDRFTRVVNWQIEKGYSDHAWLRIRGGKDSAFSVPAVVSRVSGESVRVTLVDGSTRELTVADPQLRAALPAGTQISVAVVPTTASGTLAEFKANNCRWGYDVKLWRLRPAK